MNITLLNQNKKWLKHLHGAQETCRDILKKELRLPWIVKYCNEIINVSEKLICAIAHPATMIRDLENIKMVSSRESVCDQKIVHQ